MIGWIRNKLNKHGAKTAAVVTSRRVGFIEEKPNVWRVVYVDSKSENS